MDIGDAFRTRIEDRIGEAIDKYFDGGFSGHVTVDEIGLALFGRLHDPAGHRHARCRRPARPRNRRSAFEAAADRLEKRLRRYKRRLKSHHAGSANGELDRHRLSR